MKLSSPRKPADDMIDKGLKNLDVLHFERNPEANSNIPHASCTYSGRNHSKNSYVILGILCFVNLINYVDRFTVAGVLDQVQTFYSLNDAQAGLIQTSFIISYMIIAPVFGYVGDRYNRSLIMAVGVLFWSATTFLGSLVPSNHFDVFIFLRLLVGIGEASFSIIAPTVIADLFQGLARSRAIALFYFGIVIGSGLGYIVGSNVSAALNNWQWALRVTPGLGVISSILILVVIKDPPRGSSDGATHLRNTSLIDDLKYLSFNPTFLLSTAGYTCVTFATGAVSWWAPSYFQKASIVYGDEESVNIIALKFGIITCVAGVLGIMLGSVCSQYYQKYNDKADPLVCAFGMLISAPVMFLACVFAHRTPQFAWFLIFVAQVFISFNWSIVVDILLYVVMPTRRAIAEALQILIAHALGDAFSPYITGAISDSIKANKAETTVNGYYSLQYSVYLSCFVLVLGGGLFLWSAKYVVEDRKKCEVDTCSNSEESSPLNT